jgi:hypothetical protein
MDDEGRSLLWHHFMKQRLPAELCALEEYRQCLDVDESACLVEAQKAVESCAPTMAAKYPQITSREMAREVGALYAKCVGISHASASNRGMDAFRKCTAQAPKP